MERLLYDLQGEVQTVTTFPDGYSNYPPFEWSPDGKYTFRAYTYPNQSEAIIDDQYGWPIIAPEVIDIWDRNGDILHKLSVAEDSNRHIEIVGWLPDTDQAVLMEYNLDAKVWGTKKDKINNKNYSLLHLASGKQTELELVQDIDQLIHPIAAEQAVSYQEKPVFLIDHQTNRIWTNDQRALLIYSDGGNKLYWIENDYESNKADIYLYDKTSGNPISSYAFEYLLRDTMIVGDWLTYMNPLANTGFEIMCYRLSQLFH